jgi:hypothetical protein
MRRKKDAEIDRICARHYSDFLSSSREMMKMKGSAQDITGKVKDMITHFNSTSSSLSSVLAELRNIQKEKENVTRLQEASFKW